MLPLLHCVIFGLTNAASQSLDFTWFIRVER
jgi:hypothetical protein